MHLTDAQKLLAEAAVVVVPRAIISFRCKYPTLRKQLRNIDSTSVANMAVVKAATTYNPALSKITTYFSRAIHNALLKEIDRNRRAQYDSPNRVPLEMAEGIAVPPRSAASRLQPVIARLPTRYRKLVHMRFVKGMSLAEIGEATHCDPRTVKRRLSDAFAILKTLLESEHQPP